MDKGGVRLYIFHYTCIPFYILHTKEYYSATRKNSILPFATTWKKLEGMMLSEISTDRERQMLHSIICMWDLKTKIRRNRVEEWLPGAGGGENRKGLVEGPKLSTIPDE